ncbi:MAG TPA: hypothetical protein VJC09_01545 [Candidatus Saccharimonadales bacterium]|nr:hypothetical protein [Candidatus Saccharimonadales bacterium]
MAVPLQVPPEVVAALETQVFEAESVTLDTLVVLLMPMATTKRLPAVVDKLERVKVVVLLEPINDTD